MQNENHTAQTFSVPVLFYLGPFRFESEIDVPELRNSGGTGEMKVTIRLGGVPAAIENAVLETDFCQVAPTEYLLDIAGTARYYVRNGNEVRVELAPRASIADVSTYLLGSVFGVLCHQNGFLPLHASAVECAGVVTAFLGNSGEGKSTLAACLRRRGHHVISDDICLLNLGSEANPQLHDAQVIPVAGWLKLWTTSLQYLNETPVEENRVFSTDDKFRLFLPDPGSQRLRLRRVVFLARHTDPQTKPVLETVPTLEAVAGLMSMTYAGYVPALAGQKSRVFLQCAGVMQHAQAWRLAVPWGLDRMDSVLDLLEIELFHAVGGGSNSQST